MWMMVCSVGYFVLVHVSKFKYLEFSLFLQVMFEKYQFHSVYIAIQAVLTLYAQGKVVSQCIYCHIGCGDTLRTR